MPTPTDATATLIAIEDVKEWRGQDVVDTHGEKLGKLDEVYYDTESDLPAFAAVKSGVFGKHLTLVPLGGATAGRSYLRLASAKGDLKGAPHLDPEVELTAADEEAAYGHFGMAYSPTGEGARRLAKH